MRDEDGRRAARAYERSVHLLRGRPIEEAAPYLEPTARRYWADALTAGIARLTIPHRWSVLWESWRHESAHRVLHGQDEVTCVAVSEVSGRPVIVSGSVDGTLRVWDLEGRPRSIDLETKVRGLDFAPGSRLAAACHAGVTVLTLGPTLLAP